MSDAGDAPFREITSGATALLGLHPTTLIELTPVRRSSHTRYRIQSYTSGFGGGDRLLLEVFDSLHIQRYAEVRELDIAILG